MNMMITTTMMIGFHVVDYCDSSMTSVCESTAESIVVVAIVVLSISILAIVVLTIVVMAIVVIPIVVLPIVVAVVIIGGITATATVVGSPTKQIIEEPQNLIII